MAEQDRFAITANRELGRNRAVESAHRQRTLVGQIRVELGMDALAVLGVDLRAFLRGFDRNCGREDVKALVRPILSRRPALNWAETATECGIDSLLRLVRHRCGCGIQRRNWIAIKNFKPKHRLSESQTIQSGAGWRACGNLSISALNEWIETVNWSKNTASGDQAPLDQIATRNLAGGIGLQNFGSIFACIFRLSNAGGRGSFRQEEAFLVSATHGLRLL